MEDKLYELKRLINKKYKVGAYVYNEQEILDGEESKVIVCLNEDNGYFNVFDKDKLKVGKFIEGNDFMSNTRLHLTFEGVIQWYNLEEYKGGVL